MELRSQRGVLWHRVQPIMASNPAWRLGLQFTRPVRRVAELGSLGGITHRMKITDGGLDDPRVQKLLDYHLRSARAETASGSAHALDLSGLKSPDVHFWSVWDREAVMGIGALKRLSESHGEIKSMHTEQAYRRKGVGSAMLGHIIAEARKMGLSRLSLETGSWPYFASARELYSLKGFAECLPFGSYVADPNSVFMTLELRR